MSINLGSGVADAVQELRHHPSWRAFLEALEAQATSKIQDSLNSPVEMVLVTNFYARSINDVYTALVAMTYDVSPRAVGKIGANKLKPEVPADV